MERKNSNIILRALSKANINLSVQEDVTQQKLLVVDDEPKILESIKRILESENYSVHTVSDARCVLSEIESFKPDLIVMDIQLGCADGIELCSQIRSSKATWSNTPILFLSVMADLDDRIRAFDYGADDYLCKPFYKEELKSRIRAILHRTYKNHNQSSKKLCVNIKKFEFDENGFCYFSGKRLQLTSTEARILKILSSQQSKIFTKAELMSKVWASTTISERTIDSHINNLRKKISALPMKVQNQFGVGYCLEYQSESQS